MKPLPSGMQAQLDGGATTLCWCWRLTRKDGLVQGFTDHDRDLTFDGTTFEAASGFSASAIKDSVGLSVDNLDVESALSSDGLLEADLAAGLYDDAKVEIFRVNWEDVSQRVLMRGGSIGEVTRQGAYFAAEVRGLAHYLQQDRGRLFQYSCDADLGDARCGIDLSSGFFTGTGAVDTVYSARRFTVSGLGTYAETWFTNGVITFTSGAASGQKIEVRGHSLNGSVVTLDLWAPARAPVTAGQTFSITAGCNKTLDMCRDRFSNVANFRGFPHMPGNDFILKINKASS